MIATVLQYLAAVLVVAGAIFALLAALGILRFPDLYTRMHAASKAGVVGAGLIMLAISVVAGDGSVILRVLIGIGFLLLTTPVSAHLLAKVAYFSGYKPSDVSVVDDLQAEP